MIGSMPEVNVPEAEIADAHIITEESVETDEPATK